MSLVRGTLAQPSVKYGRNNVCSQHFWCSTQGCAACRCGYLPSPSRLSPPPPPSCIVLAHLWNIRWLAVHWRSEIWEIQEMAASIRFFSQSRDLEETIEDNADNWNGSPPFRGDCYCDRRNDDTRRIIFTFYDTMKFDIEIFVLPRLIIFRREDTRRYKCWFVNFIKIDLFYI